MGKQHFQGQGCRGASVCPDTLSLGGRKPHRRKALTLMPGAGRDAQHLGQRGEMPSPINYPADICRTTPAMPACPRPTFGIYIHEATCRGGAQLPCHGQLPFLAHPALLIGSDSELHQLGYSP